MRKEFTKVALLGVAAGALVMSMGLRGCTEQQFSVASDFGVSPTEPLGQQLDLFARVLVEVQANAVEEHSYRELADVALAAMVKLADPAAEYENSGVAEAEKNQSAQRQYQTQVANALYIIKSAKLVAEKNKVPGVTYEKLVDTGLKAMLSSLDPHSAYHNAEEWKAITDDMTGQFGGVGVSIGMDDADNVKVLDVVEKMPAERAGVKKGDTITHVDGAPVKDMDLADVVTKTRGKRGTPVEITVTHANDPQPKKISIVRDIIHVEPVSSRLIHTDKGNIGYIQIKQFSENSGEKFHDALSAFNKAAGGAPSSYIVDLRNNPGGRLDQAAEIADRFLEKGEIVSLRGRDGQPVPVMDSKGREVSGALVAEPGDDTGGAPLVILTNANSASASEFLSATLKHPRVYLGDKPRATVFGEDETTYGKGSAQAILPLKKYHGGAIRITSALYYAPEKTPQVVGVTPDIKVNLPQRSAEETAKYEARLKKYLDKLTPPQRAEFEAMQKMKDTQTGESLYKGTLKDKVGATREMNLASKVCEAKKGSAPDSAANKDIVGEAGKVDVALACAVEYLQNKPALTVIKDRPVPPAPVPVS